MKHVAPFLEVGMLFLEVGDRASCRAGCRRLRDESGSCFHSTRDLRCMLEHGGDDQQIRACKCFEEMQSADQE